MLRSHLGSVAAQDVSDAPQAALHHFQLADKRLHGRMVPLDLADGPRKEGLASPHLGRLPRPLAERGGENKSISEVTGVGIYVRSSYSQFLNFPCLKLSTFLQQFKFKRQIPVKVHQYLRANFFLIHTFLQ